MYRIRIKFELEIRRLWHADTLPLEFAPDTAGGPWVLKKVSEAGVGYGESWSIRSAPIESVDEASRIGLVAQSGLMMLGLTGGYGISLAPRIEAGMIFEAGLPALVPPEDTPLRDRIGVHIYEDIEGTRFVGLNPVALKVSSQAPAVMERLRVHFADALTFDERGQLAFELYSSSRSENSTRARFLLLVMGLEALLEQTPRTAEEQEVVRALLAHVEVSSLDSTAKDRLRSAINGLLYNSIGYSGARLLHEIGGANGANAFRRAYQLRSRLVHGGGGASLGELDNLAAELDGLLRQAILIHANAHSG